MARQCGKVLGLVMKCCGPIAEAVSSQIQKTGAWQSQRLCESHWRSSNSAWEVSGSLKSLMPLLWLLLSPGSSKGVCHNIPIRRRARIQKIGRLAVAISPLRFYFRKNLEPRPRSLTWTQKLHRYRPKSWTFKKNLRLGHKAVL